MDERTEQTIPQPRTGKDGKPVYDQEFFLALARCGKEVWNKWRAANDIEKWWELDSGYICVTFAGIDFSKPETEIDFSGFDFGHEADFSGATFDSGGNLFDASFGDFANLSGARFRTGANLSGSSFGNFANLSRASFGDGANLIGGNANLSGASFGTFANLFGARFGDWANLSGSNFGDGANLSDASFGGSANLTAATFGNGADLSGASFGDFANLSGASFGSGADLSDAGFGNWADLSGANFGDAANLSSVSFGDRVNLRGVKQDDWRKEWRARLDTAFKHWSQERKEMFLNWPANATSRPDRWSSISFAGARFEGSADFTGRTAEDGVDFTSVCFGQPPTFDSLEGYDLYGARIGFAGRLRGWTGDSTVGNRLRHLRKFAEDSKNHDLERDLYIEERKAERGIYFVKYLQNRDIFRLVAHTCWIAVMAVYWLLADCGRSFMRPLVSLILAMFVFHAAFWFALGPKMPAAFFPRAWAAVQQSNDWFTPNLAGFPQAARAYALANSVPIVGALSLDKKVKTVLACRGDLNCETQARVRGYTVTPLRLQALSIAQTFISTLCFFFIGLALRNYFRVK